MRAGGRPQSEWTVAFVINGWREKKMARTGSTLASAIVVTWLATVEEVSGAAGMGAGCSRLKARAFGASRWNTSDMVLFSSVDPPASSS